MASSMAETGWLTLGKMGWERVVGFLPKWVLKKIYPTNKLKERIFLFTTGGTSGGPQFHVTPGRQLGIETNEIAVVSLLPFSIELEGMHVELLIGGMQFGSKDIAISQPIKANSFQIVNLRFELSDNQAAMARDYFERSPLLQMGITAKFRTHHGLIPLTYDIRIRAIIYVENAQRGAPEQEKSLSRDDPQIYVRIEERRQETPPKTVFILQNHGGGVARCSAPR
jgi:hypothetical protein